MPISDKVTTIDMLKNTGWYVINKESIIDSTFYITPETWSNFRFITKSRERIIQGVKSKNQMHTCNRPWHLQYNYIRFPRNWQKSETLTLICKDFIFLI